MASLEECYNSGIRGNLDEMNSESIPPQFRRFRILISLSLAGLDMLPEESPCEFTMHLVNLSSINSNQVYDLTVEDSSVDPTGFSIL